MTASRTTQSIRHEHGGAIDDDNGLLLVAGDGVLTTHPLGDETVIGRAAECDVVLEHPELSRKHAIVRLGPPLTVQDLGSKNGTRVAGSARWGGDPVALSVGDSFQIGTFSFIVVHAHRQRSLTGDTGAAALRVVDPTVDGVPSMLHDIARSGISALILGETGVGKDVLAATLHQLSRRSGAFVRVNCAALAPSLFESEIFGHERGAFTGAAQSRVGLLEAAQRGTVFLDEVGELSADAQAKLLRAIETKEVIRVGGVKPIDVDVRFVAATNRDLSREVAERRFRADLFFRLDGVTLLVPPLRERRELLTRLAIQFACEATRERGARAGLAPDVLRRLESHDWPGNVRELKAVIERAALLARGGEIAVRHLAFADLKPVHHPPATPSPSDEAEREKILAALDACAGNQTRAAKLLGVSRATLVNKLAIHRIPRPRK